jgi:hypothetical protein
VRGGEIANPDTADPAALAVRSLAELIAAEPRLTGTAVQTTGSKGYDGFILALVTA